MPNTVACARHNLKFQQHVPWCLYSQDKGLSTSAVRPSAPSHTLVPDVYTVGRELFEQFTVFRHSVLEMDRIYETLTGSSMLRDYGLFEGYSSNGKFKDVWPISLILQSITMFHIAPFDLLTSFGIKPDIVVGHSAGETAMLYASGAAPKEMSFELAVIRGRVFAPLEVLGGSMAAISCGEEDTEETVTSVRSELPDSVFEIACFNSPSAIAIAGHDIAITRALEVCQTRGVFGRKIRTSVPMHSSMMEQCGGDCCRELRALFERYPGQHVPQIPTYSTLTGERLSDSIDADYFWRNTRSPVRFTQAMERLTVSPSCIFVEISPHPILVSYISYMARDASPVISTMHRVKPNMPSVDHIDLLRVCSELTASGFNEVNLTALNNRACYGFDVSLPAYPFSTKSNPLYPDTPGYAKQMEPHLGPLNHRYLRINKDTHPVLAEHVIRGEPIMPAARFSEMAIEFGATALLHVDLKAILSLSSEIPPAVEVELKSSYWKVQSVTSHDWHSGKVGIVGTMHTLYSSLSYFSAYGPRLRRVTNVYYSRKETLIDAPLLGMLLKRELVSYLTTVLSEFLVLFFEVFAGNKEQRELYASRVQFGVVRTADLDKVLTGEELPEHPHYDIVVVFERSSEQDILRSVLLHCGSCLAPGVISIVTAQLHGSCEYQVEESIRGPYEQVGMAVLGSTQGDSVTPSAAAIVSQRIDYRSTTDTTLFAHDALIFAYSHGQEMTLQQYFRNLDSSEELDMFNSCAAIVSIVNGTKSPILPASTCVMGVLDGVPVQSSICHTDLVSHVFPDVLGLATVGPACLLGFLSAVLAPGPSTFRHLRRLQSMSMLMTHAHAPAGRAIAFLYFVPKVENVKLDQDAGMQDRARVGKESFHLIISGHEGTNAGSITSMQSLLLQGQGRMFLWKTEDEGVTNILRTDVCSIHDALAVVVPCWKNT
ncbi:predicted protein [Postia placenta Mad-698-R]|nr:predicted protein [Postia placenta Mad-698-R]